MAVEARQQFLESPASLCNDGRGARPALDFYLNPFHKQEQIQRAPNLLSCPPSSSPKTVSPDFAYCIALQMNKQRLEIDQFLQLHHERLRLTLQQYMRNQIVALTRRLDSRASATMRQKEEDLARETKRTAELEECLRRVEEEGQTWRRIAQEKEAMALSLQNTLQQVRDSACRASAQEDDAASCCDSNANVEGGFRDVLEQGKAVSGSCRGCGCQDSCMLFIPCMHLCACLLCDSLLDSCPVCRSAKQDSIEVLLS